MLKTTRRRLLSLAAVLVALGLIWVGYIQWLIHAAQFHSPSAQARTAIVLGAALWNDRPSPGLRERLDQAYALYEDRKVDRLIVSGGLDNNGATVTEAEGMKRYLIERGVPADEVIEEPEATSTYENLLFSKAIMDREGWTDPIIVTHQYHGARAVDIARFVGFVDPAVALTDSQVMWMPWHKVRETLAYTKWIVDKLRMKLVGSAF
ncbi:YdcF family protein [Paenibacillus hodogayensis]|uniref:YdcF family protein n=1 Tax=Paenibacillus hodogayensis TaxID=279208 RepID=A0ABV5W443_9BACL